MAFTELNTVEHLIIERLTGINLNASTGAQEPAATYASAEPRWHYVAGKDLARQPTDILVEGEVRAALIRLNPTIAAQPGRADEVLYKLRAILLSVQDEGLVGANEKFARWLRGEVTMPFGPGGDHVTIRLVDFADLSQNRFVVTNQFHMRVRETKIPDVVLLLNGIPVVVGEAKTPVRPAVSWFDGAFEIHQVYENAVAPLFVPNILSFATEGKEFRYGAVRTPLDFWAPWRLEDEPDELARLVGMQEVGKQLSSLLQPRTLLDILLNFTTYTTNAKKRKIKVVARYQQFEGTNAIVKRVVQGKVKKGLIWHFQGSGKSLLMLFAAQKLRRQPELKNPTVIIVVDRQDLDAQISGTFTAAGVANLTNAESINDLRDLLEKDTRKPIVTTMQKFQGAAKNLNTRSNIIMMVDEAHRTQEGNLGRSMREALPNAFLFGLTGTPINRTDKNTFAAFGADEDAGGYLSRYTFGESIRDQQTLPLHFEPRLVNVHVDKEQLDVAFGELANDLDEQDRNTLSKKASNLKTFQKAPDRVRAIAEDVARHYQDHVAPQGFKAMLVAPDRPGCVLYKAELDKLLPPEASAVVVSVNNNDEESFKKKWNLDKGQQEKLLTRYNDEKSELKILIVTAKLLTGFDAPVLQTMYLDKSLKDHTLLQAICRTNRLAPDKTFGRIVDYFGVFDETATALGFDEEGMREVVTSIQGYRDELPILVAAALGHFSGVDRSLVGFEALSQAQDCIPTNDLRDAFAVDYGKLAKVWEALSPDDVLSQYAKDYKWLSQVYQSVRPSTGDHGRLLWLTFGAETERLIYDNIRVAGITDDMDELVLDDRVIADLMNQQDPRKAKQLARTLAGRLGKHGNNDEFKKLSERLEAVRDRAEKGLINSIEFIKELCQIAKDTLQAEKEVEAPTERNLAAAALTDLFQEMRTEQTPAVVERIVNDVDGIVKIVRFPGWQTTVAGEKEVQKSLRKTLLKYQLHKEEELFQRAYEYIKEYY